MDKLRDTFNFLKKNPNNSLEVKDLDNNIKIESPGYRPDMTSYDAFKSDITKLVNQYNKIGLQKVQKNGNTAKRPGPMQEIRRKQNTDVDQGGAGSNPIPSQHQNTNAMMNGPQYPQPSQGLGYAEIGKLTQFDEVKADKLRFQDECEKLKEKNKELEMEMLKLTLGKESQPGVFQELMKNPEVLTQMATVLGQAISKGSSAGSMPSPSLNAPQKLSDVKQKFIADLVQMDPNDQTVMRLVFLLKAYVEGKTEVITEIEKLYTNATS